MLRSDETKIGLFGFNNTQTGGDPVSIAVILFLNVFIWGFFGNGCYDIVHLDKVLLSEIVCFRLHSNEMKRVILFCTHCVFTFCTVGLS